MKNRFQHAIAATALLALGFAASPVLADDAADKITSYVEIARSVFGGDKTAGDVVSAALADAADAQETVGELAATLSAAEVAKDDPAVADALAGIVSAVNDAAGDDATAFASRAAATVAAVTGKDIASALADEAFADAASDPDSVLDATEKADLQDLYEKVLAALKGADYKMKEDGDKANLDGKGKKSKDKKGKDKGGKGAEAAGAAAAAGAEAADGGSEAGKDGGSEAGKDGGSEAGTDGGSEAGKDGGSEAGTDGGSDSDKEEDVVYDDDQNLGDPLDQTLDPGVQDPTSDSAEAPYGSHEYHATPTTISGVDPLVPVVTPPTKPKPTKPSPTPVGLR